MKALKLKKLTWILIYIIFLDIISTIIGVFKYNQIEQNPLKHILTIEGLLIANIFFICLLFWFINNYHKHKIFYAYKMRSNYLLLINMIIFVIIIRGIVVINNIFLLIRLIL